MTRARAALGAAIARIGPRTSALLAAITAGYVVVRAIGYAHAPLTGIPGDSPAYLGIAKRPLFSGDFLLNAKPWGVPLFYKLAGGEQHVGQVQLVTSIVCWLALAGVVAAIVGDRRLRPVAFALVLVFSLSIWITQWDKQELSESLSVSLGAATVAAWLALVTWPRRLTIAIALVVTLLWVFARDTNAYVVLLTLPVLLVWLVRSRRGRIVAAVALAGATLIVVASLATANAAKGCFYLGNNPFPVFSADRAAPLRQGGICVRRWYTLLSTVSIRVLTRPKGRDYFTSHGMPLPPLVRRLTGQLLAIVPQTYEPPLRPFVNWFDAHGRSTYASYLLSNPAEIVPPRGDMDALLSPRYHAPRIFPPLALWRKGASHELPEAIQDVVFPPRTWELILELAIVAALTAAALARGRRPARAYAVCAFLVAITPLHALVVWHGDPADITRHALLVGVLARLALLIAELLALDALLRPRLSRPAEQPM